MPKEGNRNFFGDAAILQRVLDPREQQFGNRKLEQRKAEEQKEF